MLTVRLSKRQVDVIISDASQHAVVVDDGRDSRTWRAIHRAMLRAIRQEASK